jgi:hypothetical protein
MRKEPIMRTTKSLRLRLLAALTGVSACGALLLVAAGSASATPTYAAAHASHAAKEHLSKITESRSQVRKPAKITFGDGSCETNTVFGLVLKGDYRAVGNAYTFDCVDAAACSQAAVVQIATPADPGDFMTLVSGPVKLGCAERDESIAVSTICHYHKGVDFEYRTEGIYTVVWTDGDVTLKVFYSPHIITGWAC